MNPLIPLIKGNIAPPLFFYMDGFTIKYPTKFDILLNEETNQLSINCKNVYFIHNKLVDWLILRHINPFWAI